MIQTTAATGPRLGSPHRISYARARLWTGIAGVGTWVVVSLGLLAWGGLPARLRDAAGTPLADFATLFGALVAAALVTLPLDALGGHVLPRRYDRPVNRGLLDFAVRWVRGVTVLSALAASSGVLVLAAGRQGGRPAALLALVGASVLMLALQATIARLVASLPRAPHRLARLSGVEDTGVILLDGDDPGFTGGFTGLRPRPVLPAAWSRSLGLPALEVLVQRRNRILESGAWTRARCAAVAWNVAGFALCSLLPGAGVTSVGELLTTALGFTLWSFLGLLLLPTPSRRGTAAADARVADSVSDRHHLRVATRALDRLGDCEPRRSEGIERIFHPVPAVEGRLDRLDELEPGQGAAPGSWDTWHLARTALFLSHAGLSLLPRSVHCNAGRPELWVYLPSDG